MALADYVNCELWTRVHVIMWTVTEKKLCELGLKKYCLIFLTLLKICVLRKNKWTLIKLSEL